MNGHIPRLIIFALLLVSVVSCKKTENDIIRAPSLNCTSTMLSTSTFANSGTSQRTTLTVGLNDAVAGSVTFVLTSSNSDFTPDTYTTTVTNGQTSVAVPLIFDGTSSVTSETITVSATSYGTGVCSAVATISATTSGTTTDCNSTTTTTAKVVCAAEAFLATLSTEQKAAVVLEYTKANAIKWSNVRCGSDCRSGLPLASMTDAQVTAALAVVAAATGTTTDEGYSEINQIRAADDVLKSVSTGYSSGAYSIAFVGTPSLTGTWQLQFNGHNIAVNTTYKAGTVQGVTPLFEGVEPRTWTTNGVIYAPLRSEQSAMAALLASLSSDQLASAKLSAPVNDVVLGPNSDGKFPATKAGLRVSTLNADQQALVLAAIKPWVQDTDASTATRLLTLYQSDLANTYLAYSGNASLTNNADYVRIDGPGVWIELSCQSGVVYPNDIRYQSVWRDHNFDYGGNFTF